LRKHAAAFSAEKTIN